MRPSEVLSSMRGAIRAITIANDTLNPRVFGSVARGEDDEDSDLDLLVDNIPGQTTLASLARIKSQVEQLTGIQTDVATPGSLKARYREQVLQEAVAL